MDKEGENKYSPMLFSDYMYKIDSNLHRTKRILLITEKSVFQLNLNLSLVIKIPIKEITGITLIKSSSAMIAIHASNFSDSLLETLRRTELIIFVINIFDRNGWQRPSFV